MVEISEKLPEPEVASEESDRLTYTSYLQLEKLLTAQRPLCEPPHHDELLFIIQHQVSELWMKLILHELQAALGLIRSDELNPCFKIFARIKLVQIQLFEQWAVLETLTPSEYVEFRHVLGSASGFQSPQYRMIEFLLGNKNTDMLSMFAYDAAVYQQVREVLLAPSIYDEFLRHLSRQGLAVPKVCVARDWSQPHAYNESLVGVLAEIYDDPKRYWDAYALCEKLVDVDEQFQLWRFRHMKTVERIIGYKRGTGGSEGVAYLKKVIDKSFFPELFDVRTRIGADQQP